MKFDISPDPHNVLHGKADQRNPRPAGRANDDRLPAGPDQFHDVAVQTDRSHRHDDEKLRQVLVWYEHLRADA